VTLAGEARFLAGDYPTGTNECHWWFPNEVFWGNVTGKTVAGCHKPEDLPAMRDEPMLFPKPCPNRLRESALGNRHLFNSGL
jgi:hypothetical protein